MKNEERVEKIRHIISQWNIEQLDEEDMIARITSHLNEACKEAAENQPTMSLFIHKKLLAEASAEALEEAAKLADEHNGCVERECLDRGLNCGVTIAERIRALKRTTD